MGNVSVSGQSVDMSNKRFQRSSDKRLLAGVCGGIAEYFGWEPTIVRIVFIVLTVLGFSGIFVYFLAWLIMPAAGERRSLLEQIIRNFQGKSSD